MFFVYRYPNTSKIKYLLTIRYTFRTSKMKKSIGCRVSTNIGHSVYFTKRTGHLKCVILEFFHFQIIIRIRNYIFFPRSGLTSLPVFFFSCSGQFYLTPHLRIDHLLPSYPHSTSHILS